jgi:sugar phosphate isomerase/epimerase
MNPLGIDTISTFGLAPVKAAALSAELGCRNMSLLLQSLDYSKSLGRTDIELESNPHGYPPYDLKTDPAMVRDLKLALADHGLSVSLAEGLSVRAEADIRERASEFDLFAELGAQRLNLVSWASDLGRTLDQFAVMMEMAAERGMGGVIEYIPSLVIGDLPTALSAIRHVGHPDLRLNLDTMHVFRSGTTLADLAEIDPDLIGYVQINDVPLVPVMESYMQEACMARMLPGEGELPLLEFLRLVPQDRVIAIEAPMVARAKAGMGPEERLRPGVEAVKSLLSQR